MEPVSERWLPQADPRSDGRPGLCVKQKRSAVTVTKTNIYLCEHKHDKQLGGARLGGTGQGSSLTKP